MIDAADRAGGTGRLPAAFLTPGSSSFTEFLGAHARTCCPAAARCRRGRCPEVPHGTTIVALAFAGGVVMAGDRRATMGNHHRAAARSRRCSRPTSTPCVGIAGTAGIAVELVRLFQVELEHYEKIEGAPALASTARPTGCRR